MFKKIALGFVAAALTVSVAGAQSDTSSKDIVDTAVAAGSFNTLAKALQAADLVDTLKGAGPFTVFAPTDAAFNRLPAGTVDMLLKPESAGTLKDVLTYHVVAGRLDSRELTAWARKGGGKTELDTVSGDKLWVVLEGGRLWLRDEKGMNAGITTADVYQSNGVIHVIDAVVMAK